MSENNQENMLDAWAQEATQPSDVTVAELDSVAEEYIKERDEYDRLKAISSEQYKKAEKAKYKLMDMMELTGKSKLLVEGVGTFSRVVKKSYKVPKDFESKKKLIDHFKSLGDQEFYQFVSVHSGTLNSYVNSQLEENPEFAIDGCGEPSVSSDLRIRRK